MLKACQKRDIAVFFLVLQEGSNTAISIAATVRIICRLFRVNIIILLFYGFLKFTAHRAATSAGEAIVYHIINADFRFLLPMSRATVYATTSIITIVAEAGTLST